MSCEERYAQALSITGKPAWISRSKARMEMEDVLSWILRYRWWLLILVTLAGLGLGLTFFFTKLPVVGYFAWVISIGLITLRTSMPWVLDALQRRGLISENPSRTRITRFILVLSSLALGYPALLLSAYGAIVSSIALLIPVIWWAASISHNLSRAVEGIEELRHQVPRAVEGIEELRRRAPPP